MTYDGFVTGNSRHRTTLGQSLYTIKDEGGQEDLSKCTEKIKTFRLPTVNYRVMSNLRINEIIHNQTREKVFGLLEENSLFIKNNIRDKCRKGERNPSTRKGKTKCPQETCTVITFTEIIKKLNRKQISLKDTK